MTFHRDRPVFDHVAITGASSGIGQALAHALAGRRSRLSLFGRNQGRLNTVAQSCSALGAEVGTSSVDVLDSGSLARALIDIDQRHPISLLIANAGVGGASALAGQTGELADAARHILEVNAIGIINTLIPIAPRMQARGQGHLAIIGSLSGYLGLPHAPTYCASKAAARVYGEALRRQLKPAGVHVTVVCPGFVATPMSATLPPVPFVWSVEQAAERILRAIAGKKAEIAFPWQLAVPVRLLSLLPRPLADFIVGRLPRDPSVG
jgi:short-subunit dehydrogenase